MREVGNTRRPRVLRHVVPTRNLLRPVTVDDRTGNLWHLCERLHIDLQRTASSTCRRR